MGASLGKVQGSKFKVRVGCALRTIEKGRALTLLTERVLGYILGLK